MAVLAGFTFYFAVTSRWDAVGGGVLLTLTNGWIVWAARQRIRSVARKQKEFLARLEGRPIEEALVVARAEAVSLPRGLIAQKVSIPFERWSAFERQAFQFIVASDGEGKARTFEV